MADVRTQMEAFAFRKLVEHLQVRGFVASTASTAACQMRTDVQNIDLMNLSGFCRNCLSKARHGAVPPLA